jgi:hypothetical protein
MRTHDNTDFVYRNPRPSLTVQNAGGASLGNCYNASYFEVTSLRPLDMEDLYRLRECGFLGYGQEFMCHQVIGEERVHVPAKFAAWGKEGPQERDVAPSGKEMVPCIMVDRVTRKVIEGEAINPYSGKPYAPHEQAFYTYRCESRVDSSD